MLYAAIGIGILMLAWGQSCGDRPQHFGNLTFGATEQVGTP
jgi:hypothetical protein